MKKKLSIIIGVCIVLMVMGFLCWRATSSDAWKTYEGPNFSFRYPAHLELKEEKRAAGAAVTLLHEVQFEHLDPCDFKGDAPIQKTLKDFQMTLAVVDKPIERAAGQKLSDMTPISIGTLNGYQMDYSVETCGTINAYFDIGEGQTLAVDRPHVTLLERNDAQSADALKNPETLSMQEADAIWNTVLATFQK